MKPFTVHRGRVAPLDRVNVDTDQIIPKQFLKVVDREGLAKGLFYDMRFEVDGAPKAGFVLDDPAFAGAQVLIAGDNFGCGSSREHARHAQNVRPKREDRRRSNVKTLWSPVTESNRRPSPYHASRCRLAASHQV